MFNESVVLQLKQFDIRARRVPVTDTVSLSVFEHGETHLHELFSNRTSDPVDSRSVTSESIMAAEQNAEIRDYLPHRSSMLLVDRIVELEAGRRALTALEVTGDEFFFRGHFPGDPVMPGVIAVETIAQTIGIASLSGMSQTAESGDLRLGAIRDARFSREVRPGDELLIEGRIERFVRGLGLGRGTVSVDEETVVEAKLSFAVVESDEGDE